MKELHQLLNVIDLRVKLLIRLDPLPIQVDTCY